jgi:hypothetical protein
MEHTITFETDTVTSAELHEALCLAIHEGDPDALAWLAQHVQNIE